jgi:hypothetical protein
MIEYEIRIQEYPEVLKGKIQKYNQSVRRIVLHTTRNISICREIYIEISRWGRCLKMKHCYEERYVVLFVYLFEKFFELCWPFLH